MSAPEPPRKVFGGAQSGRSGAVLDYDRERYIYSFHINVC